MLYAGVLFVCTRSLWEFHSGSHNGTARFVVYCTCAKYRVVEYYRVSFYRRHIRISNLDCLGKFNNLDCLGKFSNLGCLGKFSNLNL
jgi:hypothetical protein